jgi:hypothetical protein
MRLALLRGNALRRTRFILRLGAVILGGHLLAGIANDHNLGHTLDAAYNDGRGFELQDLQRYSSVATLLGSTVALAGLEFYFGWREKAERKQAAVDLLRDATGSSAFPAEYRAAIAYVIQELENDAN